MSATIDDKKLNGAGLATLWGIIKQYIVDNPSIPKATASTLGCIMVGTTLGVNNSGVLNLASGVVTAGTYKSVTVDTYGRVTAGTNPNTLAGYGITDAKIVDGSIILGENSITPITSLSGYATQTWVQQQGYLTEETYKGTVTQVKVGTTAYDPTSGVVSLPAYPTTLPASDVYSWAKAASKPSYTASEVGAATSGHTHTTSIATSSGTNQLTLAFGTKYVLTAGGTSYIFTMPSNPNTNTTYKFTIGSTTNGDATNGVDLGTLKSETAAASGTTLSLVTTGEKATWNAKSNLTIGTTATTAAAGNHTHTLSIATSSGTNALTLAANTKYVLTAGGSTFIFTTPTDTNTWRPLGTGASDACSGNDSRLSDSRPASDVYSWAKASSKPTYTASEVGAATSNHTHGLSIATDSGTNQVTLAHGTKYKLTAGGSTLIFTMPSDNNNTYPKAVKNITRSGTTFTATCYDDTTFTFDQQDNNTTYSVFTDAAAGLAPAASSTNKTTAESAVGNYYLCADGKYRQLPANAFLNSTYTVSNGTYSIKALVGSTTTTLSDFTANQSSADDFTLVQGSNITFTVDATNRKLTIAGTANSTYPKAVKNITRSGTTFTATCYDDTTFTFDQQDNNTWKAANTSQEGYAPKLALASTATIATQSTEYVLTYISGSETAPVWRKLPANAFKNDNTNTWRNVYTGGTSRVGTGTDTKAINFVAGSNVSISYEAAGTGSGQSGNANYFNVKIAATDTTYSAATQSADGLMSAADKKKLDGIASGANAYSLPTASADTLGGIKVGTTLSISSGVLNLATSGVTAGTYKRVTVDSYGRVTSGDNSDADTNTWRGIYVKGTSSIGTGTDTKALNFAAGSNVSISFAAAGTGSGQSGNANYFNIKIAATDTTYSVATQSANGLMSAADKKKLDGISIGSLMGSTSIGDTIQPVYWNGSAFKVISYTIAKSVPSDAKFTDTNTWRPIGTGASDAAAGNHTHTLSIATDTGTNAVTLAHGTKYKLTAGGSTLIFTMPTDNNTTYSAGTGISLSGTTFSISSTYQTYISNGNTAYGYFTDGVANKSACLSTDGLISSLDALNGFNEAYKLKYGVWNGFTPTGLFANGIVIDGSYADANFGFQIAIDDDPTYKIYLRQRNGSGWASWKQIPMGDGTGASGTWDINITGSASKVTNTSDMRKKNVVKDNLSVRLTDIANAPLFDFKWKDTSIDTDLHIGSSAQYWKNVIPEAVSVAKDEIGTLSMQYDVIALSAVISVAKETLSLKEKVALLETRVESLEKKIREYESN